MSRFFVVSTLVAILITLAACGPLEPTPTPPPRQPTATATARPSPTPRPTLAPTAVPAATAAPLPGGEFREIVAADAVSFHPYQATDATSSDFQSRVYASGLWRYDPQTLQPIPNMAESWTSSDGRTFTFNLRRDLKWSDGVPLTAYDFQWTFDQASKAENRYPYVEMLWDILSYKAKDDYTLEIVLKEPTCVGLTTADAITPLPRHIWSRYDWNDPTKNPEIHHPTVVSGVYRLQEWKRGESATFVRNEMFFRGAANFDSVTVRIVPNPTMQFQLLRAGEVDTAPVRLTDFAEAKQVDALRLYTWEPASASWEYIGFNLRRAFLKDVAVRRALAYATPRQLIADEVFQGLAQPTYSTVPPTSWAYNPEVPRYDYSIETAQTTLAQAGYKLDASGRLLAKDGKPAPRLKILYNSDNQAREQIARILRDEFKKLGIESEIAGMEFQAYLDYLKREPYDYDLYVLGWHTTFDPYFGYQVWSEDNIPFLNAGAYVNRQVEKLYEQSNHPPCDTASRRQVFGEIQRLIADDAPYIFVAYRVGYQFVNQRIVPNAPTALGIRYLPEKWYLAVQ